MEDLPVGRQIRHEPLQPSGFPTTAAAHAVPEPERGVLVLPHVKRRLAHANLPANVRRFSRQSHSA